MERAVWVSRGRVLIPIALALWAGCGRPPSEAGGPAPAAPPSVKGRPPPEKRPLTRLVAVADAWMPFTGEAGGELGVAVELARAALLPSGYRVEYRVHPWSRCLELVRAGQADLAVCAVPAEAPDLVFPAEPVAYSRRRVYVLRGSELDRRGWRCSGPEEMDGLRLVVPQGYDLGPAWRRYADRARRAGTLLEVGGENPLDRQIAALELGRADVALANADVVAWRLRQLRREGLLVPVGEAGREPLFVAVSPRRKDARELAGLLTQGLRRLRRERAQEEIRRRYGVSREALPAAR
ncbi:MAG: substrate-binding periplasmic protein [Fimbriimonadaceae bacterium]